MVLSVNYVGNIQAKKEKEKTNAWILDSVAHSFRKTGFGPEKEKGAGPDFSVKRPDYRYFMALPSINRLRDQKDIKAVLGRGSYAVNSVATLRYLRRDGGGRFAFIVSKRTAKKSSVRNLIRRRASEWVRRHKKEISPGFDAVIIFKKDAPAVSRLTFYSALEELFRKTPLF